MKVSTYQRRTPPRDRRVQIDMSAEEARNLIGALNTLRHASWIAVVQRPIAERVAASNLQRALVRLQKEHII